MRNPKALAALESIASLKPLFENPEITAMAAICEILQELPDDPARLRVMRWSFGRFAEEFKRPLPAAPQAVAQAAAPKPAALALVPTAPVVAPDSRASRDGTEDLATEVEELRDLFPRRSGQGLSPLLD